jgi:hypothetical protein
VEERAARVEERDARVEERAARVVAENAEFDWSLEAVPNDKARVT